ncbi:lysophospholipase [Methylocaldum sp.]|uniref:alpha/beta hydrolase n=1 Tax=Methylocaldum sp. TaxID=1969727 RepID=UPI002D61BDAC|nr:lysophospholipase [Methylocaldum sp.]HYE34654.1 alpha/beta hydrolase [Methylocaldum sp.]
MNLKVLHLSCFVLFPCLLLGGCTPLTHPTGTDKVKPQLRKAHFVAADRTVLPVRSWLPENGEAKAVIVALHGFNDYSNAFAMPGRYLSEHGIALYAYDQRGFGNAPGRGLWAGMDAYADDLRQFTRLVGEHHSGKPVFILGESMGGALAIVTMASERPPAADGIILSAPAVWGRDTMPWYQRVLLSVSVNTVPWLQLTGESLGILPSDNIEMLRGLGRDPLVIKETRVDAIYGLVNLMDEALSRVDRLHKEVLLLYGERDQVIPKEPVSVMLKKLSKIGSARVAFYEQGYHLLLRDLGAAQPWGDIAAWVADRTQPLPSGADKRDMLALTNP